MVLFLGVAGLMVIPLGIYLYVILCRFLGVFFGDKNLRIQKMTAAVVAAASAVKSMNLFGIWALVVCYFTAITLVIDLARLVCRKAGRRAGRDKIQQEHKIAKIWDIAYRSGALAAAVTAAILGYAYVNMHNVITTRYAVSTEKPIREEGYRIVFVSDLHFGTTMNHEKLAEYCARMEQEKPDLVVLGGDIVDENTTLKEAEEAFTAMAQVDSTLGTYYVYGNHDKGRYSSKCDFTQEELAEAIQKAGVHILEDDTVVLNEDLAISGRRDRSDAAIDQMNQKNENEQENQDDQMNQENQNDQKNENEQENQDDQMNQDDQNDRDEQKGQDEHGQSMRKSSKELIMDLPRYYIMADHQPRDMAENASAGYDLMLSGHTHAGQMWPVGLFTTLFDKGTVNYGQKSFGDMELIVSSGMAGWGYPLRTGRHSEFVVVSIDGRAG